MKALQPLAIVLAASAMAAGAQPQPVSGSTAERAAAGAGAQRVAVSADDRRDVLREVDEAVQVVQRLKADPRRVDELNRARAVFVLTSYARGALGVGVQGGQGVLVKRQGEDFSNPVFYRLGGISIGAQAGGSGGHVAFLLMTDKAVSEFESSKKFSLDADAGLTIVDWSRRQHASAGKLQDVITWSDTKGAYAGVSVGVTDVMLDKQANRAYYGREGLDPRQIISGQVDNPHNNVLGLVLGA